MKSYDIVCALVEDKILYTSEPNIKNLLPIDRVYYGYGTGGGVMPIVFEPHEDYDGEGYKRRCDTDNNEQRIIELNAVNEDIDKYNAWAREKNKAHTDEVFVTIPYDGKVYEEAELKLKNKYYPPIRKHTLWDNSFSIARPYLSKPPTELIIRTIDSEELYHQKERLGENEFIQRFNAGVFAFIQDMIKMERELGAWGEDSVWFIPNKEFVYWFSSQGLDVSKIEHFIFTDEREKDIWPIGSTYLELAYEARELVKMGDYENVGDAYQYMADIYWFHRKGNPVKREQIGSEWRKAKSGGRIPDHLLDDDD